VPGRGRAIDGLGRNADPASADDARGWARITSSTIHANALPDK
jgi:hypothetical protein